MVTCCACEMTLHLSCCVPRVYRRPCGLYVCQHCREDESDLPKRRRPKRKSCFNQSYNDNSNNRKPSTRIAKLAIAIPPMLAHRTPSSSSNSSSCSPVRQTTKTRKRKPRQKSTSDVEVATDQCHLKIRLRKLSSGKYAVSEVYDELNQKVKRRRYRKRGSAINGNVVSKKQEAIPTRKSPRGRVPSKELSENDDFESEEFENVSNRQRKRPRRSSRKRTSSIGNNSDSSVSEEEITKNNANDDILVANKKKVNRSSYKSNLMKLQRQNNYISPSVGAAFSRVVNSVNCADLNGIAVLPPWNYTEDFFFTNTNENNRVCVKVEVPKKNNKYCEICGNLGFVVCCDFCPSVYHTGCLPHGPWTSIAFADRYSEKEVEMEPWQCPKCYYVDEEKVYENGSVDENKNTRKRRNSQRPPTPELDSNGSVSNSDSNSSYSPNRKTQEKLEQHSYYDLYAKSCMICGGVEKLDQIILCDQCDDEYHLYCLNPPLSKVPGGNWYCPNCQPKKKVNNPTSDSKNFVKDNSFSATSSNNRSGTPSLTMKQLQKIAKRLPHRNMFPDKITTTASNSSSTNKKNASTTVKSGGNSGGAKNSPRTNIYGYKVFDSGSTKASSKSTNKFVTEEEMVQDFVVVLGKKAAYDSAHLMKSMTSIGANGKKIKEKEKKKVEMYLNQQKQKRLRKLKNATLGTTQPEDFATFYHDITNQNEDNEKNDQQRFTNIGWLESILFKPNCSTLYSTPKSFRLMLEQILTTDNGYSGNDDMKLVVELYNCFMNQMDLNALFLHRTSHFKEVQSKPLHISIPIISHDLQFNAHDSTESLLMSSTQFSKSKKSRNCRNARANGSRAAPSGKESVCTELATPASTPLMPTSDASVCLGCLQGLNHYCTSKSSITEKFSNSTENCKRFNLIYLDYPPPHVEQLEMDYVPSNWLASFSSLLDGRSNEDALNNSDGLTLSELKRCILDTTHVEAGLPNKLMELVNILDEVASSNWRDDESFILRLLMANLNAQILNDMENSCGKIQKLKQKSMSNSNLFLRMREEVLKKTIGCFICEYDYDERTVKCDHCVNTEHSQYLKFQIDQKPTKLSALNRTLMTYWQELYKLDSSHWLLSGCFPSQSDWVGECMPSQSTSMVSLWDIRARILDREYSCIPDMTDDVVLMTSNIRLLTNDLKDTLLGKSILDSALTIASNTTRIAQRLEEKYVHLVAQDATVVDLNPLRTAFVQEQLEERRKNDNLCSQEQEEAFAGKTRSRANEWALYLNIVYNRAIIYSSKELDYVYNVEQPLNSHKNFTYYKSRHLKLWHQHLIGNRSTLPRMRQANQSIARLVYNKTSRTVSMPNLIRQTEKFRQYPSIYPSWDPNLQSMLLQNCNANDPGKRLALSSSTIEGVGVFSGKKTIFTAHDFIMEIVGELKFQKNDLINSECGKKESNLARTRLYNRYWIQLNHGFSLDCSRKGNLLRFLNHSCQANCSLKMLCTPNQKIWKVLLYANQDIGPDEELTINYSIPSQETSITCCCGESHCKGVI